MKKIILAIIEFLFVEIMLTVSCFALLLLLNVLLILGGCA